MQPFELTLIITERCNLACSYCFCDRSRNEQMSATTAVRIIGEAALEKTDAQIGVLFFGGEPLLNFDCIRRAVEALENETFAPRLHYKIVTNGTLFTPEIKQWLQAHHARVELAVSIDGDAETQEHHRGGSFARIDRQFLRELGRVEIKMVVTPDTLDALADNIIAFASEGFSVHCELAEGIEWKEQHCTAYARALQRVIEFYLHAPALYPVSLLGAALELQTQTPERIARCRPGITSCAYDTAGKRYECQRRTPLYNNGNWAVPCDKPLAEYRHLCSACAGCVVANLCNACPASIALLERSPEQARVRCLLTKTALLASANMVLRMARECPEHCYLQARTQESRMALLHGAKTIWENLEVVA